MCRRQASKVVLILQAAAAAMKLDSGRHGDDLLCVLGMCSTVFYAQYKCTGPGANENGRVAWSHELTDAEAAPFLSTSFIDGNLWVDAQA